MTGFFGVLGEEAVDEAAVVEDLTWTGRERRDSFADGAVSVTDVHRPDDGGRPAETGDGCLLWVWGSVFGADRGDGTYERRPFAATTSRYCADRYDREGMEFVAGLNGHFFGMLYDPGGGTVSFFTDRLGTVDAYYATPTDGAVLFTSALQSLERVPATDWAFDPDYLCEFFAYTRPMGVETPLEGASLFPPATVTTVDLDGMERTVDRYWRPRHRPVDAPFSEFVDAFVDRFRASLADRTAEPGDYGVLLSGGGDSRLVLAALEDTREATAYHMANWMSREARTAERVALTAGVDFELLRRDEGHLARDLRRTPALSNFRGTFNQAHAEGFMPALREEEDYLVDGLYGDILFKGWGVPRRTLPLGPLGTVPLPLAGPMESIADYLDEWETELPQYVQSPDSMRDILGENIFREGGRISHHGVTYDSPVELLVWSHVHPQTNMGGGFQIRSIRQHLPYRNPMLDNRLIDLSLSMPVEYFLRRSVVDAAVERLAPDLAAIPHPSSGVPLDAPFPLNWLGRYARGFWRTFVREERPPRRDLGHGPWEPAGEVIRARDFVGETLAAHEGTVRALPFLDWEGVRDCYRDHLRGADNARELYTLVTFLEMPLTGRMAARDLDD